MTIGTPLIKMPVGKANLEIKRGVTFDPILAISDDVTSELIDFTGFTGRLQMRATLDSATVLKELTTENGGILTGNGTVQIVISAADTADLDFDSAVYDLEVESPEHRVSCLLEGLVAIKPEVTR